MVTEGLPPVDIILPVFNQPDWTKRCLRSIFDRTSGVDFRVFAMDDCSTDTAIAPLLRDFVTQYPDRMIVLHNPMNEGFVKTVNRGMRFSDRDVVLLNTDTEVSSGWLKRLATCAYRNPRTASVTPVSNEASIYSVFQLPAEMDLIESIGVEEAAQIVMKCSRHQTPNIPTGVGFCFYIKRAALEEIGTFDTSFGRGYGEENDWCMRAIKTGWHHVLDDSTFVYHEGHVTMRAIGYLERHQTCVPENERLLRERHPDFDSRVSSFLRKDVVLPELRRNILRECMNEQAKERMRIGFILHGAPTRTALGGTELHVHDLIHALAYGNDILVLYPNNGVLNIERYVGALRDTWSIPIHGEDAASSVEIVLREYPRDIVHIHHTLGLGFSIIKSAKESGACVVYSIHDYYAISPNYTLTDNHGYFHGIPKSNDRCPGSKLTHEGWQKQAREGLTYADTIVVPSSSALAIFDTVFGDIPCPRRVLPHGIQGDPYNACGNNSSSLTVCFLGYAHAPQKGRAVVEPVIRALARSGIRCILVGSSAKDFPKLQSPLVQCTGSYKRDDLPHLLQNIQPHMVALLSTYPETFCYALSEAWQAGIPAYVSDTGALSERMRETGAGWIAPSLDAEEIAQDIALRLSDASYQKALRQTQMVRLPSRSEMGQAYIDLYNEICGTTDPIDERNIRQAFWTDGQVYTEAFVSPHHQHMPSTVRPIAGWLQESEILKLYQLAYKAEKCIVEVGCYAGKSTTVLACGARDSGKNVSLVSIDISPRYITHARKSVEHYARYPCTFLTGRACDVLEKLPCAPDLVFIDGDHSYAGARNDLQTFRDRMCIGGILALHDYARSHTENSLNRDCNVVSAVRDTLDARYEFLGTCGSLGVFQYASPLRTISLP